MNFKGDRERERKSHSGVSTVYVSFYHMIQTFWYDTRVERALLLIQKDPSFELLNYFFILVLKF